MFYFSIRFPQGSGADHFDGEFLRSETRHHGLHLMGDELAGGGAVPGGPGQRRILHAEGGMDEQGVLLHQAGEISATHDLLTGFVVGEPNPVSVPDTQFHGPVRMDPHPLVDIVLELVDTGQHRVVAVGGGVGNGGCLSVGEIKLVSPQRIGQRLAFPYLGGDPGGQHMEVVLLVAAVA